MIPIMQIIQTVRQIKQNPAMASQFLYQKGIISQQQYQEMQQQGIDANPEAIGQYMMSHGMMDPNQAQQAVNQYAVPIQNSMKQN